MIRQAKLLLPRLTNVVALHFSALFTTSVTLVIVLVDVREKEIVCRCFCMVELCKAYCN